MNGQGIDGHIKACMARCKLRWKAGMKSMKSKMKYMQFLHKAVCPINGGIHICMHIQGRYPG